MKMRLNAPPYAARLVRLASGFRRFAFLAFALSMLALPAQSQAQSVLGFTPEVLAPIPALSGNPSYPGSPNNLDPTANAVEQCLYIGGTGPNPYFLSITNFITNSTGTAWTWTCLYQVPVDCSNQGPDCIPYYDVSQGLNAFGVYTCGFLGLSYQISGGTCVEHGPKPNVNAGFCQTCWEAAQRPTVGGPAPPPTGDAGQKPMVGDPVNPATGNVVNQEVDYVGTGPFPLRFVRTYNSDPTATSTGGVGMGANWRYSYSQSMYGLCVWDGGATGCKYPGGGALEPVYVARPDGSELTFGGYLNQTVADTAGNSSSYASNPIVGDQDTLGIVTLNYGSTGAATSGTYVSPVDDSVELYNMGQLASITNRAGLVQTVGYSGSNISQVTDPFGRTLTFSFNGGLLTSMTDPAGGVYQYSYSNGVLASVTYPDGKTRTYQYSGTLLTGIVDENGSQYVTYTYNANGQATMTQEAGGVGQTTISGIGGNTSVTDALGTTRQYAYSNFAGALKNAQIYGQPCPACGYEVELFDAAGFPKQINDWNSNAVSYVYDDVRGLELSRTEGYTSPQARTIATTWLPNYRLPSQITEPLRTTNFSYDPVGNLLNKTITANGQTRAWNYTYDNNGQMLTAIGPRTDLSQVTTYGYDSQGDLASVTNALGQVTNIGPYDGNGRPLQMVDPNGLVTRLTYDPRERLTSRNVGGELTTYTYDGVGQLINVTMPDQSSLTYTYDPAHRLTNIADSLGNSIAYTLDNMGNRIQENVYDPTSTLTQTLSRVYNTSNQLYQQIGAAGQTTIYTLDGQGDVTQLADPLSNRTYSTYDALNRLIKVTDPIGGITNYAYDSLDQLTQVTDPVGLITQYTIDGLGNVNQIQSPDTGITASTYDSAGNLLTKTDAKHQTTSYTYDALNRVTSIAYADPTLAVTFTYDQGTNGVGRLTGLTDNSGSTAYTYEIHGRLTSEIRTIGGVPYTTAYSYDAAGRLASMTYPSGRQVSYTRDGDGRIKGVTTTQYGVVQTVLTGVAYRPFGPEQSFGFGNNQTYTRGYDQDGRVASFTLPNATLPLGYDAASRITSIPSTANPANVFTVGYDNLDRLTSFAGSGAAQSFIYDIVGNRTHQTINANSYTAAYAHTSNQIVSTTGPTPKTYTLDANGSIVNDTFYSYGYDARGRMNQSTNAAGATQYLVNAMGQRVEKSGPGGVNTVYHYDASGHLIAESDPTGKVQVEYIYLNDIPVGVLK